ncbi:hypothetical protein FACS189467_0990 [Bacteroidia bacterium]|nr:hypothetical protein FACS189467_0990 [Bacteroidia bacterium]
MDTTDVAIDKDGAINVARRYAQVVQDKFGVARFILFGSYAKGNYHEDSDIDLAVIFDDYENGFDRNVALSLLRRNIDLRIEPHAFRTSEFTADDPLAYEVMKYGSEIV